MAERDFRIGDWLVQPSLNRVSGCGRSASLCPKFMDLLVFLASRAGEVVSKDEIIERVWEGRFVSESVISRAVSIIRKAIRDSPQFPRMIETIPKRGYRVVAPVSGIFRPGDVYGARRDLRALSPPDPGQLAGAPSAGGAIIVGRESELSRLSGLLAKVLAGAGRVVFITGEAGTGKTALATEFIRRAIAERPTLACATGNCNAHTGAGDPCLPFREILRHLAEGCSAPTPWDTGRADSVSPPGLLTLRLAEAIVQSGPDLIGTLVSGDFLSERLQSYCPAPTGPPREIERLARENLNPLAAARLQQTDLFEQFARVMIRLAAHGPLILMLDDLQWADGSSINLLFHLGRRISSSAILVLAAYRPSEVCAGRGGGRHPLEGVVNELQRHSGEPLIELKEENDRSFVDCLLDAESNQLGAGFREMLYCLTRAHPLFTTELLRILREKGHLARDNSGCWIDASPVDWRSLPARVEGVIAERIERLSPRLQSIVTVAAVEGERFTGEVLGRVLGIDDMSMVQILGEELDKRCCLIRAEGSTLVEGRRFSRYRFRHVLFQKYIHDRLDAAERAYLHEKVGLVLESLIGDLVDSLAADLAWHFREAGSRRKAVDYYERAGKRARRLLASHEAIAQLSQALDLLDQSPESAERTEKELDVRIEMTAPIIALEGPAAPRLLSFFERTWRLCRLLPDSRRSIAVLQPMRSFYTARGDHQVALRLADEMLQLSESVGEPGLLAASHISKAMALIYLGEPATARYHLEVGLDLCNRGYCPAIAPGMVYDPEIAPRSWLSVTLWMLGFPDLAVAHGDAAIARARSLDNPHSLAFALTIGGAMLAVRRREPERAIRFADEAVGLSRERRFGFLLPGALVMRSVAQIEAGDFQSGCENLRLNIEGFEATGARYHQTPMLSYLAQGLARLGRADEAFQAIDKARTAVESTGERFWEAEVIRTHGEVLLAAGGDPSDAAEDFRSAVSVACRQGARALELRAATSLARLLCREQRGAEASELLEPIYRSFTEGLDTPDLRDARAVLEAARTDSPKSG